VDKNLNSTDRIIRIAGVAAIGALVYFQVLEGVLGAVFSFLAMYLTLTAIRSSCPLYRLLKIRTHKKE